MVSNTRLVVCITFFVPFYLRPPKREFNSLPFGGFPRTSPVTMLPFPLFEVFPCGEFPCLIPFVVCFYVHTELILELFLDYVGTQ